MDRVILYLFSVATWIAFSLVWDLKRKQAKMETALKAFEDKLRDALKPQEKIKPVSGPRKVKGNSKPRTEEQKLWASLKKKEYWAKKKAAEAESPAQAAEENQTATVDG